MICWCISFESSLLPGLGLLLPEGPGGLHAEPGPAAAGAGVHGASVGARRQHHPRLRPLTRAILWVVGTKTIGNHGFFMVFQLFFHGFLKV